MKKQSLNVQESVQQIVLFSLALYALTRREWILIIAALLLIGSLSNFSFMAPIARAWWWALELVSKFNRIVLLSVMFYLFITPYAFLFRAAHRSSTKKFMGKESSAEKSAYTTPTANSESRESFERLW